VYILLDLEATCWITPPRPKKQITEIIEIAAIAFEDPSNIIDNFHTYIKPEIYPNISESCKELTGIKQIDLDLAEPFKPSIQKFEEWLDGFPNPIIFVWGNFDKAQIIKESMFKKYTGKLFKMTNKRILAIDKILKKTYSLQKTGLLNVLSHFGLSFEGIPHKAEDDIKNTLNIIKKCYPDIKDNIKDFYGI